MNWMGRYGQTSWNAALRAAVLDRTAGTDRVLRLYPFHGLPVPWSDQYLLPIAPPLKKCPFCGTQNADDWGCMSCGIVFKEWNAANKVDAKVEPKAPTASADGACPIWLAASLSALLVWIAAGLISALISFNFVPDSNSPRMKDEVSATQTPTISPADAAGSHNAAQPIEPATASTTSASPHPTPLVPAYAPIPLPSYAASPFVARYGWSARMMLYNNSGDRRFLPPADE